MLNNSIETKMYTNVYVNNKFLMAIPNFAMNDLYGITQTIAMMTHIPSTDFYLLQNGKQLGFGTDRERERCNEKNYDIHVVLRVWGGKGGFGSMLRAIGAQIEKTTNREACRDLSGRRLRDINEEKRLKEYLDKLKSENEEQHDVIQKKIDKLLSKAKHEFKDEQYERARSELTETVASSVEEGFRNFETVSNASSSATTTTAAAAAASTTPSSTSTSSASRRDKLIKRKPIKTKNKNKGCDLWLGFDNNSDDLSTNSDSNSDDSDSIPNKKSKNNDDKELETELKSAAAVTAAEPTSSASSNTTEPDNDITFETLIAIIDEAAEKVEIENEDLLISKNVDTKSNEISVGETDKNDRIEDNISISK